MRWQDTGFRISVEFENLAETRLYSSYGVAHLMQPGAPELVNGRDVFGLPDLALQVLPESGDIESAKHGYANVGDVDLVVDVDAEDIFTESALLAFLAAVGDALLKRE